jgi:hypothetical protein
MNSDLLIRRDLQGFITEKNFDEAEEAFPGIATFYEHCRRKPRTFLDLVWQFESALSEQEEPRRDGTGQQGKRQAKCPRFSRVEPTIARHSL